MDWRLFLETYGYFAFYLLLIVEGQPAFWLGGVLLALGIFKLPWLLFAPIFILIGDYLYYLIGLKFGSKLIDKYGRLFFLTKVRVDYLSNFFIKHRGKTIIICKLIYGLGRNVMIVYGLVKGKWKDAWKWSLLGATLSYSLYVCLGYFFGSGYVLIKDYIKGYGLFILLGGLLLFFGLQSLVCSIKEKKLVLNFNLFNNKSKNDE